MSNAQLENLESQMKRAFHKYNMGFLRLATRLKSRGKLYLRDPKMFWGDIRKFLSWLR
jgi:anaerobic magnesium-protoporphyrin IX monomethyl ester cyclase